MVASYLRDMAKVWKALRVKTNEGAKVCFVIGDSAPYGIYLPVDRWFGELALAYGFKSFHFDKNRDRNVKWKIENIEFHWKKAGFGLMGSKG